MGAEYEQFALFLEPAPGRLASASLELTPTGVDLMYATDVDEALLMIRQEEARLAAVVADAGFPDAKLRDIAERLCSQLPGGSAGLAVVGLEPGPETLASLREQGVEWGLFEPYAPRELRFVTIAAEVAGSRTNRRKSLRVPADLDAVVEAGVRRREASVWDLSPGGCYLATQAKLPPDSELSCEIALPDGTLILNGFVRHAIREEPEASNELAKPRGFGVEFAEPDEEQTNRLRNLLGELVSPYRL